MKREEPFLDYSGEVISSLPYGLSKEYYFRDEGFRRGNNDTRYGKLVVFELLFVNLLFHFLRCQMSNMFVIRDVELK